MKKRLAVFAAFLFLFSACSLSLDGRLDILEERIQRLERLCEEMNANISAIKTVVEGYEEGYYIVSITPVKKDGKEIGYVIQFSKGDPITIYHGKNGADGTDGKDGYVPEIGVAKDYTGFYFWTIDGKWLLDDSGQKIRVEPNTVYPGKDGQDGQDGIPGADGKDGRVPQLKLEDGFWYISYDNGFTWNKLGAADGTDGKDGEDADTIFQEVDTSNQDYVVFKLSDGTEIRIPTWSSFEKLKKSCQELNSNIEALNVLVSEYEQRNQISGVRNIYDKAKIVGYEIRFTDGKSISIYYGKDAVAEPVPEIGITKDVDGIYYWTMNGEWMLDPEGRKMRAQGTVGDEGKPGDPGTDGITPLFKIENDTWYVSYDNGEKWNELGRASGEDGIPGKGGDPLFNEITFDSDNAYFDLVDGRYITIPFESKSVPAKIKSVTFVSRNVDGRVPVVKSAAEPAAAVFDFLVYPAEAVSEIQKSWETLLSMKAVYTQTRASVFVLMPVTACHADPETGMITVTVSGENLDEAFYAGEKEACAVFFISDDEASVSSNEIRIYPLNE